MKTPEQILKQHAPGVILFGISPGYNNSNVINAMIEYAKQEGKRVEEFWENAHAQTECRLNDVIEIKNNTIDKWIQAHEFNKNTIKAQAEEIEKYMKESATYQARKDTLEEWLTEYRDELRDNLNDTHDEFVKSRRRQLIGEINELLNWEL